MTQQIVQALNAKYMASKLEAAANLQNYLTINYKKKTLRQLKKAYLIFLKMVH